MTELLFFAVFFCGCFAGAVFWERRFEEMLPMVCSAAALLMVPFALFGWLRAGAVAVLLAAGAAFAAGCLRLWRSRNGRAVFRSIATPAFVVFAAVMVVLRFLDRGMLLNSSDELGHWGLAVKEMLILDDLYTSALSVDRYQNYPPIMGLFQYFLQWLYQRCSGEKEIFEELLMFAWQFFTVSFLLPALSTAQWKKPFTAVLQTALLFMTPLLSFSYFTYTITIDPFLSLAAAYVFAMVFSGKIDERFHRLSVLLTLSVLVLAKDSGMLFAWMGVAAMLIMAHRKGASGRSLWKLALLCACAVLLPKLIWSLHLSIRHCRIAHESNAGWREYIRFLLLKDDSGYRYSTVVNFLQEHYRLSYHYTLFGLWELPYIFPILGTLLIVYVLRPVLRRNGMLSAEAAAVICPFFAAALVIYSVGMCYIYLFRMPLAEITGFSAMDRYYDTMLCAILVTAVQLLVLALPAVKGIERSNLNFAIICLLLLAVPRKAIFDSISHAADSRAWRAPFREITDLAKKKLESDDENTFIVVNYWRGRRVMAYEMVPYHADIGMMYWYDLEPALKMPSCEDWMEQLRSGYSIVVLFDTDDIFTENYADAFENPEEIQPYSVYRVNPETGKLTFEETIS